MQPGQSTCHSAARLDNLRQDIRAWLRANLPHEPETLQGDHGAFVDAQRSWFLKLVEAGYAVPHWPAPWPGGGRSLAEQKVIYEEIANAGAPRLLLSFVSTYHAFATIDLCGNEAQKARYIPAILGGETWCQGFSEPNAGSDLAAVATSAQRQGDVYVVNGQKVWSTMAQYADRCLLLVRTSRDGPKQSGLTYLLLDMTLPGITVRPICQIQGDQEFAEIFLDDVAVPANERVGEEGEGWKVAQTTLASERGLTLMELGYRLRRALSLVASSIRTSGRAQDSGILRDFGKLATQVDGVCALADRYLTNQIAGTQSIGDASLVKNSYSRALRAFAALGLRIEGLEAHYRQPIKYGELTSGNWMADFMNSYAWTIAGGSEEIQRNIIAERVMGMPREPRGWLIEETVR